MPDNHDPLSQLWQQQKVVPTDLLKVSKKWRKIKLKQRCYVVLDILSVAAPFALIWHRSEKLDNFTMTLMLGVLSLSVFVVAYITWLRRFSFGWSNASTDQYIKQLQKQIESNIKIANLSLNSVWFTALIMLVLHGGLYYFEVFPTDKLIHKAIITFAIIAVMLPCIWVWAFKRKKRFSRELLELNDLLEGGKV
jgi:hypothetical protein